MVEQVDREALLRDRERAIEMMRQFHRCGQLNESDLIKAFAAHRLAAEKAERERIADWLDEYANSAIDSLVADLARSVRAGEYER